MLGNKYKIIMFDLGGVLINVDWNNVCQPLSQITGVSADAILKEIMQGLVTPAFMRGSIDAREFYRAFCGALNINNVHYDRFVSIWNSPFSSNLGISPLVNKLKESHRLVLGSNTDELHFSYALQHLAVLKHFERYILSYEIGRLKPEPEFYLHALRETDVSPAELVFIDDRMENVESARSLGITAIRFESNEKLANEVRKLGLL